MINKLLIDKIFKYFVIIVALTSVITIFLIFVFIAKEGIPVFYDEVIRHDASGREIVSMSKLFFPQVFQYELEFIWQPSSEHPKFSVLPLIVGSLKVTIIAILFSAPLAIAAAVYTSQFAGKWFREIVKPVIEFLAGIPSVVLGFLALIVMATWFQEMFGFESRLNGFTAGIAMGIAVIPIIFTISEDALNSVPKSYIEASLSLGASRTQTTWKVILPAVIPGIFAAVVLGFGRAIGETMIVLMASGNAALLSLNFADSVRTLSAAIASEMGDVVVGSTHYTVLFFLGMMLFVFTFIINYVGDVVVNRFKNQLAGLR